MGTFRICALHPYYGKSYCYSPDVAHGAGRGIFQLFHDRGTRSGVSGQQHAPAALYPRERPGAHFTGGWAHVKVLN